MQVTAPDNDVVDEVPVFGSLHHPRSLLHVTELEDGICDGKAQFRADGEQPVTANIHVANTVMTIETLLCDVISDNPGIDIAQRYYLVIL